MHPSVLQKFDMKCIYAFDLQGRLLEKFYWPTLTLQIFLIWTEQPAASLWEYNWICFLLPIRFQSSRKTICISVKISKYIFMSVLGNRPGLQLLSAFVLLSLISWINLRFMAPQKLWTYQMARFWSFLREELCLHCRRFIYLTHCSEAGFMTGSRLTRRKKWNVKLSSIWDYLLWRVGLVVQWLRCWTRDQEVDDSTSGDSI